MKSKPGELLIVIIEKGFGFILHAKGGGANMFLDREFHRELNEFEDLLRHTHKQPGVYRVKFDFIPSDNPSWHYEKTEDVKWELLAKFDKKNLRLQTTPGNDS